MKKFYSLFKNHKINKDGIIAIGYFDSFHLGHQKIISELVDISRKEKKVPYVLTYVSLPQKNRNNGSVLELDARIEYIRASGIRNLILCEYDEKFAAITPEDFVRILKTNYNINHYVVGKDFHFGTGKTGNIRTLKENDCLVDVIEPYCHDGQRISTSLIREKISKGEVDYAAELMGRRFSLGGIVHKGKQLGRTIGFPTMNINNVKLIRPGDGTYATKTYVKGREYFSMTYVSGLLIESHLFGYSDYRYNLKINIDFFKKIRDNKPFSDIDGLKDQLSKDLETTRRCFKLK
jgi:riboflavin kinase / FMN adenylyltransferase